MKNILLLVFMIILSSCTNIDKKELTIIDSIVLGERNSKMISQFDSIGLTKKTYLTQSFFSNIDDIDRNKITTYETHVFDLSKFRVETNHIGLFYLISASQSNDNIIGINVLFGHTNTPTLITPYGIHNLEKEIGTKSFFQDIPLDLLQNIKYKLETKYGKPVIKSKKATENEFYVIEGSSIKEYIGNEGSEEQGAVTVWKTEYLDIKLFEGFYMYKSAFTNKGYSYSFNTEGVVQPRFLNKNEHLSVSYVCLQYKLNKETIQKMKLNEDKI